ncbi:MAG TPA: LPS assembly protein LptD, partial [Gammaproteobacteria bacterium]|nr:LPS assembly protein LptD [Gammaproteobacteria bacterium]
SVSGQPIGKPSSPTRSIFLFEVASELFLERDIIWGGVDYVQTLVPRLAYHYVPYKDQSDLPVFDSGSVGFNNIADAYLSDGFWGADRIQNFQGFTLGLESDTYASESGDRMMKWTLAQQVYLADREVTLNTGDASATSSYSPLLGELDFNITQQWNASGFASWNWDDSEFDGWRVGSAYTPGSRRQINLAYQSEGDDNRNLEIGLNWPLAPRWQLGASGLFGESEDGGQYTRISLGYDACCWAIRLELEDRPIVEDDNSEESGGSRIMFTLRLKGLGTISSGEVLGLSRGFSTSALAL